MAAVLFAILAFKYPQVVQKNVYKYATEVPSTLGMLFLKKAPDGKNGPFSWGSSGGVQKQVHRKVAGVVDAVYGVGYMYANTLFGVGAAAKDSQTELSAQAVVVTTLVFTVTATGLFFISYIGLGMYCALLPLFVVLYLFGKIGKGLFMAWVKTVIAFMFTILFASIVLGVCYELLVATMGLARVEGLLKMALGAIAPDLAKSIWGPDVGLSAEAVDYATATTFIAALWLCIFFLKQVPQYAANIAGVVTSSMYEFGHAMAHAGYGGDTNMTPRARDKKPKPKTPKDPK